MRKKDLQKIALIAEIVSGVVVVVTIAFLAIEMRNNTTAIHVQTHLELADQLNAWRESLTSERIIKARETVRSEGINNVPREARNLVILSRFSLWSILESAFSAYRNGALDENGWERYSISICMERASDITMGTWSKATRDSGRGASDLLSSEFRQYIESTCE